MKRRFIIWVLVVVNLALAWMLVSKLTPMGGTRAAPEDAVSPAIDPTARSQSPASELASRRRTPVPNTPPPATVFTRIYSEDPKAFVANLRSIRCPEQTVRDIIMAGVTRQFLPRIEELRPKPADHVPFNWSANTSEAKLLERRQQAAALAREQATALREALGYDVPVQMPTYALTTGEQRFIDEVATFPPDLRSAVRQIQDDYWARVQVLQNRTKAFWQTEDVAELERLKQARLEAFQRLPGNR